jgi:hypothetical protein
MIRGTWHTDRTILPDELHTSDLTNLLQIGLDLGLVNAVNKSADEDRSTVNLVLLEKSLIRVIMEVLSQLLGIIWLYSIELIVAE